MKAFVLAGGIGSRLEKSGITAKVPKPLLEIGGKTVLDWNIENLKNHGVKTIVLGLGHRYKEVEDYFKNRDLGVELILSFEEQRMGTAGALKLAEKYFSNCENFFMCNGDEVKNVDYSALLEMHEKNDAIASIALYAIDEVSHYGVVKLEGEKIIEFVEKPSKENAPSNLISSGAYVLSNKIFEYIHAGKEVSIEKEVFPKIVEERKLFGKETVSSFLTIDTPERYHKTVKEFK
ncbi:MAG: nucleotidyltransferase family protein [archaeon]